MYTYIRDWHFYEMFGQDIHRARFPSQRINAFACTKLTPALHTGSEVPVNYGPGTQTTQTSTQRRIFAVCVEEDRAST